MNNDRRKSIQKLLETIDDARSQLDSLRDEEQDYYDAMPEGFQNSSKGEAAEEAVSNLESAISSLEDAVSSLEEAMQ